MSTIAIKAVPSVYFFLFYHTTVSSKSFEHIDKNFQWQPTLKKSVHLGRVWVRDQLWDRLVGPAHLFSTSCTQNDPTTKRTPSLA